jgi:hypothetical protein
MDEYKINTKIDESMSSFNIYHKIHPWIPSYAQSRRTPKMAKLKEHYYEHIFDEYETKKDFILHQVFDMEPVLLEGRKWMVIDDVARPPHSLHKTALNPFPSIEPKDTLRYVHWIYPHHADSPELDVENTNRSIVADLAELMPFRFVWYENPRKSLPHSQIGMMHVHVLVFRESKNRQLTLSHKKNVLQS